MRHLCCWFDLSISRAPLWSCSVEYQVVRAIQLCESSSPLHRRHTGTGVPPHRKTHLGPPGQHNVPSPPPSADAPGHGAHPGHPSGRHSRHGDGASGLANSWIRPPLPYSRAIGLAAHQGQGRRRLDGPLASPSPLPHMPRLARPAPAPPTNSRESEPAPATSHPP
jgi:hypothetical protein